jgi:exodeoxyribonuclease VII large subunit
MTQMSLDLGGRDRIWTVGALTAEIHRLLSRSFDDIRVAGEISGYRIWPSGHAYFTLKDADAQLRCVIFRNALRYVRFRPRDGLAVIVRGSLEVRQDRGEYQFLVSGLEPQGYGALQLAFEQLKQRLEAEGLFAVGRKKPLPRFPRRIGIVTSPQGAVIRDMLTVLSRRWPGIHVRLFPTLVQGEGAVEGVCEGLRWVAESGWPDVVIVGRGGGSLEDLWTFNEEAVARAIAASPVPVISAVGHETDFTIADFVADLRAPTPSAAAELVVPNADETLRQVEAFETLAARATRYRLAGGLRAVGELGIERTSSLLHRRVGRLLERVDEVDYDACARLRSLFTRKLQSWRELDARLRERDLRLSLARHMERFTAAERMARESILRLLTVRRSRLDPAAASLEALSPLHVLERGYAIVVGPSGAVVHRPGDVQVYDPLRIRLAEGDLRARVEPGEPS